MLIMKDKRAKKDGSMSFIEHKVMALRNALQVVYKGGGLQASATDREKVSSALRAVWSIIHEAEIVHDFLFKAYMHYSRNSPVTVLTAASRSGVDFRIVMAVDLQKASQYKKQTGAARPVIKGLPFREITDKEAMRTHASTKEWLGRIRESRDLGLLVSVNDVDTMKLWHESREKKKTIKRIAVVVDNTYVSYQGGGEFFLRRHSRVLPSKLTAEGARALVNAYEDTATAMGDALAFGRSYSDNAKVNILVAALAEVSRLLWNARTLLDPLTRTIAGWARKYQYFDGYPTIETMKEAVSVRYADGVTVYAGASPTKVYSADSLRMPALQRFAAAGKLSVDTPKIAFRFLHKPSVDRTHGQSGTTEVWKKGREFSREHIDGKLKKTLSKYEKYIVAVRQQ